jgi:FAD synthetase
MVEHKRETMKEKKGKIVLASGTFDLLHLGHVKYLEEAKKAGGSNSKLIVIVARDKTVEKRKGRKPVMPEDERKALVESLKVVNEAILGRENFDIDDVIDEIKPDIIAVGHDQANIEQQVRKVVARKGLNVQVVRIGRFGKPELYSSLKIKRKVTELYKG